MGIMLVQMTISARHGHVRADVPCSMCAQMKSREDHSFIDRSAHGHSHQHGPGQFTLCAQQRLERRGKNLEATELSKAGVRVIGLCVHANSNE